jgi:hypothetical protein
MTKETYKFDYKDTPLCLKLEEIVEILWTLKAEELTTNELIWFSKLKLTVESVQDDIIDELSAVTLMYGIENNLHLKED